MENQEIIVYNLDKKRRKEKENILENWQFKKFNTGMEKERKSHRNRSTKN